MQNNQLIISSFENGDEIKGFYLCKYFQIKISRLGDEYIDLILEDSSGSIRSKIWSYVDEYKKVLKKNSHVAIKGKVITFNDVLEIDISYINLIENNLYDKYGYSKDIILKFSTKQTNKLLEKLIYYTSFVDKEYSKPLLKLINDNKTAILRIPSINFGYRLLGLKILEKYFKKNTPTVNLMKNLIIANQSNDSTLLNTIDNLYTFDTSMNNL